MRLQDLERSREAREVGAGEEGARGEAERAHNGEADEAGGAGEAEARGDRAEDAREGAQETTGLRAQRTGTLGLDIPAAVLLPHSLSVDSIAVKAACFHAFY